MCDVSRLKPRGQRTFGYGHVMGSLHPQAQRRASKFEIFSRFIFKLKGVGQRHDEAVPAWKELSQQRP